MPTTTGSAPVVQRLDHGQFSTFLLIWYSPAAKARLNLMDPFSTDSRGSLRGSVGHCTVWYRLTIMARTGAKAQ